MNSINEQELFTLLGRLAERLVWVAPVGNGYSRLKPDAHGTLQPTTAIRGFMVCRRAINNVDEKNSRVDFLRVDASVPCRWKKPFRECECMFASMESAIMAAAHVEGIALPATQELERENASLRNALEHIRGCGGRAAEVAATILSNPNLSHEDGGKEQL